MTMCRVGRKSKTLLYIHRPILIFQSIRNVRLCCLTIHFCFYYASTVNFISPTVMFVVYIVDLRYLCQSNLRLAVTGALCCEIFKQINWWIDWWILYCKLQQNHILARSIRRKFGLWDLIQIISANVSPILSPMTGINTMHSYILHY